MPSQAPPATLYQRHVHFVAGAYDIQLPVPQFGDRYEPNNYLITHTTQQNRYEKFRPQGAAPTTAWNLRFEYVSESVMTTLKAFLREYAGKQVTFRDMENAAHTIILTRTNIDIETIRDNCREYAFEIEFLEIV